MMIAGQVLNVEGKDVLCPSAPLFFVKSMSAVIDINHSHFEADKTFRESCGSDKELWKLTEKGTWKLLRRVRGGREQGATK